ncbi:DUF4870 family protein [Orrella marina]|uniref:Transmembrane protein n=1 Tax=Orrella marina TaxID=2163011 RepID=A0A2R4XIS3_9BURK|nr:hypothetical protein [Orrella marina]AWB33700.1 hypothetical protein DBV39_08305 [Orrella marina]
MSQQQSSNKTITHVIYALYALGLILGLSPLVAIIMNYVKRGDVSGTWLESHFVWQIRTFWYAFAGGVIGALTIVILIGYIIIPIVGIWYVYRIVKGWLYLVDDKPMSMSGSLL